MKGRAAVEEANAANSRVLVLGTGTSVGKTFVTAALLRALRDLSPAAPPLGLKLVETGLGAASDARTLALAGGLDERLAEPCYAFLPPVSPHLAAERAGTRIEPQRLANWVREREQRPAGGTVSITLLETAGGAFTPLGPDLCNADLAVWLDVRAVVLVAPDRLGVLHDVTAALRALAAMAIRVDAVVLSAVSPPDASSTTNAPELERLGLFAPCLFVPRDDAGAIFPLARELLRNLPDSPRRHVAQLTDR
jgi:dethiobiotin synthetase